MDGLIKSAPEKAHEDDTKRTQLNMLKGSSERNIRRTTLAHTRPTSLPLNSVSALNNNKTVFDQIPPLTASNKSLLLVNLDSWSTRKSKPKDWVHIESQGQEFPEVETILDQSMRSQGFHYEFGRDNVPYTSTPPIQIEDPDRDTPFYKLYFSGTEHHNFVGSSEVVGPVVIHMEVPKKFFTRSLVRTKKGDTRIMIPSTPKSSTKDLIKYIKSVMTELKDIKFNQIDQTSDVDFAISEFERKELGRRCKIGVLYVKDGQKDENEIYSNIDYSEDFEEFLDFIGTRVELKGFEGFSGGLDTKHGNTGTHSVYTKHENFEIMFHVAPLLPFQEKDKQRVERKRHLGNDVVLLIFKEGDTPFNPQWVYSHFNHVFAVVQVHEKTPEKTLYKMSLCTKSGVEPYGPYLPSEPIFEKNEQFRKFLLTKLINGEKSSMRGGEFKATLIRTRNETLTNLTDLLSNYKKKKRFSFSSSPFSRDRKSSLPSSPSRSVKALSLDPQNRKSIDSF